MQCVGAQDMEIGHAPFSLLPLEWKEPRRPATQARSKNCLGCKGILRTFENMSIIYSDSLISRPKVNHFR